jgi:hypothetical protein
MSDHDLEPSLWSPAMSPCSGCGTVLWRKRTPGGSVVVACRRCDGLLSALVDPDHPSLQAGPRVGPRYRPGPVRRWWNVLLDRLGIGDA